MTRAISVAGGKTGVGTSTIALNLALSIAGQGYRTTLLLMDAQFYGKNLSSEFFSEKKPRGADPEKQSADDLVIRGYHGIDIFLGGSILSAAELPDSGKMEYFLRLFSPADCDFFIIDTPPGNTEITQALCMASSDIILVMTPEPSTITGAHAFLKTLGQNGFNGPISVVVNQSKNVQISGMAIKKLNDSIQKSFAIHLESLGDIAKGPMAVKEAERQTPFVIRSPDSIVVRDIQKIALNVTTMEKKEISFSGTDTFWKKLSTFSKAGSGNPAIKASQKKAGPGNAEFRPDGKETPAASPGNSDFTRMPDWGDFKKMASPGDLLALLAQLSENIAMLSGEIRGLKMLMEPRNRLHHTVSSQSGGESSSKVTLDFESFLSRRLK